MDIRFPEGSGPSLDEVRDRIEDWRRTRTKISPMPAELWEAAATLAETMGVFPVSKALKINYQSLKRRSAPPSSGPASHRVPSKFVEYSLSNAGQLHPFECEIRIKDKAVVRCGVRDVSEIATLISLL